MTWILTGRGILLLLLLFILLLILLEILRELKTFRVRQYRLSVNIMEPGEKKKIVFLTDLHGKSYGKNNGALIKAIVEEKPDYIFVGGDMLTRTMEESDDAALRFVRELPRICPVYAANGNHEQKMKEFPERYKEARYENYKRELKKAGVRLLENAQANLRMGSLPVTVSGLEIPAECYGHFLCRRLPEIPMDELLPKADNRRYQILLAHNPVYAKRYWEWGADLVLSGHLHGGIVRLPLIGGLITPQIQFFPKYSGDMYEEDGHVSIVSRGLGTHTVNIRLFNMAEVVSVTLEGPKRDFYKA